MQLIQNGPARSIWPAHLPWSIMTAGRLLIDDHGSHVTEATWSLYRRFIDRAGAKPTLIEWDTDVPDYAVLMAEVDKAAHILILPGTGRGTARSVVEGAHCAA